MEVPVWIPVASALVGAIAVGAIKFVVELQRRKNRKEAILRALAGEVGTLCQFIRLQDYVEGYREEAQRAAAGQYATMLPIDARQNYFTMYEAVAHDIGELSAEQAIAISRFYTLCKIAMDTARPGGQFPPPEQNLLFMSGLSALILREGDAVIQFPSETIKLRPLS